MPVPYVNMSSGLSSQTCSYTSKFISDNAEKFKAAGMSQADYQTSLVQGHFGMILGKEFDGSLKVGTVLYRAKHLTAKGQELRVTFIGDAKVSVAHSLDGKVVFDDKMTLGMFKGQFLDNPNSKWSYRVPTEQNPTVAAHSTSPGSLTDEQAAIMFVKTKDDFAQAKGINIKGANPQLDAEVYESIAKVTGFTPAEIKAKIEAYKASGKKLSALKKKTVAKQATTKTPEPTDKPSVPEPAPTKAPGGSPSTPASPAPSPSAPITILDAPTEPIKTGPVWDKKKDLAGVDVETLTVNGHKAGTVKLGSSPVSSPGVKYSFGTQKAWKGSMYDTNGQWVGTFDYKTKEAAKSSIENWAKNKGFGSLPPKHQAPKIHTQPSAPAVKEAVADLNSKDANSALLYAEEDIVKAYIKSKDKVAASPDNPFTLYSKGPEFDLEIRKEMSTVLNGEVSQKMVDEAVSSYLGAGNKLSVLKKKMVSSGEMKKEAPSLKKTKAEQLHEQPPTTSPTQAAQQVADVADAAVDPIGSKPFKFSDADEDALFNDLKNSIYAGLSESGAYEKFALQAAKLTADKGENVSILDVIRAYDKKKAAQLGIDNGAFYEKKVMTWAASPEGKVSIKAAEEALVKKAEAAAKAAKDAAEKAAKEAEALKLINSNIPDLPPDSVNYQVISVQHATDLQNKLRPWMAEEKQALTHYTGGSFRDMNSYLRGETSHVSTTNRNAINKAQDGMRATEEEFIVHRGAGYNSFGQKATGQHSWNATDHMTMKNLTGMTVEDEGFLSTSVGGKGAFGGPVKLEIEIAKGTHGAFVDPISLHRGENEFLIARGTKYRVLQVTKDPYGGTVIRLRTVPGSHSSKRH